MTAFLSILEQYFRACNPHYQEWEINKIPLEGFIFFSEFYFDPIVDATTMREWLLGRVPVPTEVSEKFLYYATVSQEHKLELIEQVMEKEISIAFFPIYSNRITFQYFEPETYKRYLGSFNWHAFTLWNTNAALRTMRNGNRNFLHKEWVDEVIYTSVLSPVSFYRYVQQRGITDVSQQADGTYTFPLSYLQDYVKDVYECQKEQKDKSREQWKNISPELIAIFAWARVADEKQNIDPRIIPPKVVYEGSIPWKSSAKPFWE
jgi:hypothetical protein